MKILCIIPARSGSKGLPNKNILNFQGLPMLVWSIKQVQQSNYNKDIRIILSTDSEEYRQIGLKYGAEVPFLRPKEISGDLSTDYECIKHCLDYLEKDDYIPDFIIQLRPTYPTRKVEILNDCIKTFIEKRNEYDSLRTVIPFEKSPYKMYRVLDTKLKPLFNEVDSIIEPYNECRQNLPDTYLHNGYIDILNTNIVKNGTISGGNIYPYIMSKNEYHDIDTLKDLELII
jgi:CMP-N,N'-diacetyllegionaminic acid synthase